MLQRADKNPGHDVDHRDDDARDRVPLREAHRAVHGAVELGFVGHFGAAFSGLDFVDEPGVEIRVDTHLLARQRVESEARRHFRDTHGAVVDDHVLNRNQQDENHDADD